MKLIYVRVDYGNFTGYHLIYKVGELYYDSWTMTVIPKELLTGVIECEQEQSKKN